MKAGFASFVAFPLALFVFSSSASVLYVNLNSTNPVSPYAGWSTAATNIQDAIDVSTNGDQIWVTNGIYQTGGKSMDGVITNRVSVDKAVTVESVNGPFVTVIQGAGMSNGVSAVRCAWLTNNATLVGFTLKWGATRVAQNNTGNGGGVWCASSNAVVANCLILSNTAFLFGSGAYQGTLNNCFISRNNGQTSSAVYQAALNSCTVASNVSLEAVRASILTNCIVYNNGGNFFGGTFSHCCTTPLPSGPGNFTNPPQLFADGIHLKSTSPCIGTGTNVTTGTDIFGRAWADPPSIGCAEWQPEPVMTPPQIQLTGSPLGFFVGPLAVNGQLPITFQWLKDGMPLQDNGHFGGSQTTSLIATGINLSDAGSYQLVASNAVDVVTSVVAQLVIHYVDAAGTNPQPPYTNWTTAATNIQDAIDAAVAGEIVLVTNGVYATGGRILPGSSTNRVVLDKALMVVSVNGYTATTIQGAWDPVSTNGPAAVRCAWLTTNAILCGFTLENGATGTGNVVGALADSGGGVFCASTNGVVANCVLTNNFSIFGGGIYGGTLNNSLVIGNVATWGGGAYNATLNNCTVIENYCTRLVNNSGAGTYDCAVQNCIVLYNADYQPFPFGGIDNFYYDPGYSSAEYSYSCTYPLPSGVGNIDGNSSSPQFLDLFHIMSTSPCRGAGSALYASGTDIDGEPWANPPSMGCDEVVLSNLVGPLSVNLSASQSNVLISLPDFWPPHPDFFQGGITGRVAYITWSFGDGPTSTNFGLASSHQWTNTGDYTVTFTAYNTDNPAGVSTNTLIHVLLPDVPHLQSPVLSTNGFQFQFAGQWNANYTIQYTTNLAPPVAWQTLQTIIWNYDDVVQISDSTPTNAARFYRVLVQ
jgi:hypothetical protein